MVAPEGLAQHALQDLAGAGARDLVHEGDRAGQLVAGQVLAGEGHDARLVEALSWLYDDHRVDALAPVLAGDAEDRDVQNVRMPVERRFDLTRKLKEELEAAGCSIPFPQRDVHVFANGGAAAS